MRDNPIGSDKVCRIDIGRVRSLSIKESDEFIWNTILDVLSTSHLYKEKFKSKTLVDVPSKEDKQRITQNLRRRNKKIDKELLELENNRNNVIVQTNSLLSKEEIVTLIKRYEDQKSDLLIQKEKISDEIDLSNSNKNWVDWVKKFGSEIEDLRNTKMSDEDRKEFLSGVLDKIVVSTIDNNTHSFNIHFNTSYVEDGFEWNFKKVKGKNVLDENKRYILINGSKNIVSEFRSVKTKKKSLETKH